MVVRVGEGYGSSFNIRNNDIEPLRKLFHSLRNFFDIVTLNITSEGLHILEINNKNTVLIELKVPLNNFEEYRVNKDVRLHINLRLFCSLIENTMNEGYLIRKNEGEMYWYLDIKNNNNRIESYSINLFDREYGGNTIIPDHNFEYGVDISIKQYIDLIEKNRYIPSSIINIRKYYQKLIFLCYENEGWEKIVWNDMKNICNTDHVGVINNYYSYGDILLGKSLIYLCKSTIQMYLKKDYPMIIKFNISNLGELNLCYAPFEGYKI